jgi:hypothetical protein
MRRPHAAASCRGLMPRPASMLEFLVLLLLPWLHACSPLPSALDVIVFAGPPSSSSMSSAPSTSRPLVAWQPSVSTLRSAPARSVEPSVCPLRPSRGLHRPLAARRAPLEFLVFATFALAPSCAPPPLSQTSPSTHTPVICFIGPSPSLPSSPHVLVSGSILSSLCPPRRSARPLLQQAFSSFLPSSPPGGWPSPPRDPSL